MVAAAREVGDLQPSDSETVSKTAVSDREAFIHRLPIEKLVAQSRNLIYGEITEEFGYPGMTALKMARLPYQADPRY